MSRCSLDNKETETEVVVGWDPGAETYFARVFDNRRARAVLAEDETADHQDAGLILWVTGVDGTHADPGSILDVITPYARAFDRERLLVELLKDKANASRRQYTMGAAGDEDMGQDTPESTPSYVPPDNPAAPGLDDVRDALAFLVEIEPDPLTIDTSEDYAKAREVYAAEIGAANSTLRAYATSITPKTLEAMQKVYYDLVRDKDLATDAVAQGVITASLKQAWKGIDPWQS